MVVQRETAIGEEREGVGNMCFWVGDSKSAKLFSMSTLMYHLVARSIEASGLRKSRIAVIQREEWGKNSLSYRYDWNEQKRNRR